MIPLTKEERQFILSVQIFCNNESMDNCIELQRSALKITETQKPFKEAVLFFSARGFWNGENIAKIKPMVKIVQKFIDQTMNWLYESTNSYA